jgi:hypothetical protein
MKYYYEDEFEKRIDEDWEDEIDEELLEEELLDEYEDEENGVVEYTYGLDENELRNKLVPDPKENPSQFSKTGVYKLQDLVKKYKFLVIKLQTNIKPNAKLFYTIRFWWVNGDRSRKKLVDWTIHGPTEATYISIPVDEIIGVYKAKGYQMSSDIFIEYRVDEEVPRVVWKVLERRYAVARFVSNEKEISGDNVENKQEEKQENKPSKPSKPKKPANQPNKPSNPKSENPDDIVSIQPVQPIKPTAQTIPIQWIVIGLGVVAILVWWMKMRR